MDADPRDTRIQELEAENQRLRERIQTLEQTIQTLQQTLQKLQQGIDELEGPGSRPAAPFRRDEKHRKPAEQHQKPGRKPGHPPAHRLVPTYVDENIEVPLEGCPHCHGSVRSVERCEQFIEDLPPTRPYVTRIRQHLQQQANSLLLPTRLDPDEERITNRLRKRRQWLYPFLDYPGVEATNNRAERALRPAVIARKLSCGNKTEHGKRTWEILASLAATCHQRGVDLVEYLKPFLFLLPLPEPTPR